MESESKSAVRKRGVPHQSQFAEALCLIHEHFVKEKMVGHIIGDINSPMDRMCDILSVGRASVYRALAEKRIHPAPFTNRDKKPKKKPSKKPGKKSKAVTEPETVILIP